MFTGIDFFDSGEAAVITLMGEVWRVSGIDDSLEGVTWRRIAAGLSQPFGLNIIDGVLHTVGRRTWRVPVFVHLPRTLADDEGRADRGMSRSRLIRRSLEEARLADVTVSF